MEDYSTTKVRFAESNRMYIADWVSYENQPDAMTDRFGTDVTL